MTNVITQTVQGTKAILKGMGVVMQHLFRPSFTVEYPEVRKPSPPRTRNRLAFLYDEDSEQMRCIGCTSCVVVCPREIIHMKIETVEKKKSVVQFDVDLGDCIGCGNCVEICPVDALELLPDFELAAERKEDLLYDMHKLGKFVPKGYLPAQYYPAKPELPKPVRAPAPKPAPAPESGTAATAGATNDAPATATSAMAEPPPPAAAPAPDPAVLSPDEIKAAARARTEALKAQRAAEKAAKEAAGTTAAAPTALPPLDTTGMSPDEIKAAARARTEALKAQRAAEKAAKEAGDAKPETTRDTEG